VPDIELHELVRISPLKKYRTPLDFPNEDARLIFGLGFPDYWTIMGAGEITPK
jgi:hypothetical protein